MNNIDLLFFELIRVAIGTQDTLTRVPTAHEWELLYAMAKKQSLVGICFAGVKRLCDSETENYCGMSELLYLKWMGMAAKIQKRNQTVNRQCVELQEKLADAGMRSYIMKGQSVGSLYNLALSSCAARSLSSLRQSGDIDVYIEGGFDKVYACGKTFGVTDQVNELEMHVRMFTDTDVEFHYRPMIMRNPFKNRKLQAFFKSEEEACFGNRICLEDGLSICAPTLAFNLVHQLAHIRLHLFTEGVGMRQLMDYYFVLKNTNCHELTTNCSLIKDIVQDLGLNRFASALMWVLGHVFGLEHDCMLWPTNEEDGRLLLSEVMNGGNFGHHNEAQNQRKKRVGYSLWALLVRNWRLRRFDSWDWFWGPVWRISHKLINRQYKK